MKDEINEILDNPKILILSYGNYISLYDYVKLKNYITTLKKEVRINNDLIPCFKNNEKSLKKQITNLQEKIEYNDLVLKALHKYFTEHECYETNEFLRQLETCNKNDMVWLKRMAGVSNE